MDRRARLLSGIDIDREIGLEIGPLNNALVQKVPGRPIFYADYASRAVLQAQSRWNPHVNVEDIPEIDFIIAPLPQTLGKQFDYIVASHVVEHVPNLLGWINTLLGWLKPGGKLVLAVPDRRYTFDVLRPESTAGQVFEAYAEKREKPTYAQVFDGFRMAAKYEPPEAWAGRPPKQEFHHTRETALALAGTASSTYVDCHCWVFTDESFAAILDEARVCGLSDAVIVRSEAPVHGSNEFHCALSRANQPVGEHRVLVSLEAT